MTLPQLQQDKANHFIYGFALFILANLFFNDYSALAIVFLIGLAKELYDEYSYGGFSISDLIYTLVPSIILILKSILIKN